MAYVEFGFESWNSITVTHTKNDDKRKASFLQKASQLKLE